MSEEQNRGATPVVGDAITSSELEQLYTAITGGFAKVLHDGFFTLLKINDYFFTLTGYSREEFNERFENRLSSVIHPDDVKLIARKLPRLRLNENFSDRFRVMCKGGSAVYLRIDYRLSEETNQGKQVIYILYTNVDRLTQQEMDYKRQAQFLSLVSSSISGGTLLTVPDDKRSIRYVSDGLLTLLGYTKNELSEATGDSLYSLVIEQDRDRVREAFEQAIRANANVEMEYRVKKHGGELLWVMEKVSHMTDSDGTPCMVSVVVDMSLHKEEEESLRFKAERDPLTRVLNTAFFKRSVSEALPLQAHSALFVLDVDNFKHVNDRFGHMMGDQLLVKLCQVLKDALPAEAVIGRVGGDEFTIFLDERIPLDILDAQAGRVNHAVCEKLAGILEGLSPSISVGVAWADIPVTYDQLFSAADAALYQAKFDGKNTFRTQRVTPELLSQSCEVVQHPAKEREPYAAPAEKKPRHRTSPFLLAIGFLALLGMLFALTEFASGDLIGEGTLLTALILLFFVLGALVVLAILRQNRPLDGEHGTVFPEMGDMSMRGLATRLNVYREMNERALYFDRLLPELGNREKLVSDLTCRIRDEQGAQFSVFLLDINGFGKYNDAFGLTVGDEILRTVASRMNEIFGAHLYRLGNDIFVGLSSKGEDRAMADRLNRRVCEPMHIGDIILSIDVKIGVCNYPVHSQSPEELIEKARSAMHYAKSTPGNSVQVYNEAFISRVRYEEELMGLLNRRINDGSLEVWFQPIYNAKTGAFHSAEALLRLKDDHGAYLNPLEVIGIAEKNNTTERVGEYVLAAICKTVNRLSDEHMGVIYLQGNLSSQLLIQRDTAQRMLNVMKQYGVDPHRIGMEITETILPESIDSAVDVLGALRSAGLSIAMDDFGSGYSSLSYLTKLPIDTIKIDRGLVSLICQSQEQYDFMRAIVYLAKVRKLKVVAEGVETKEVNDRALDCGVDYIQGFYYARPMPEEQLIAFLSDPPLPMA